jgi:hypothetical protein
MGAKIRVLLAWPVSAGWLLSVMVTQMVIWFWSGRHRIWTSRAV